MRTCGFPGCTKSLEGRPKCTVWCVDHAIAITRSRRSRKEAYKHRKSVARYANVIKRTKELAVEPPRTAIIVCKHCYGIPWARCVARHNESHGSGTMVPVAYPPGLGVPGHHEPVCRGCGLPYAPEPALRRQSPLSSSAGLALAFGSSESRVY